MISTGDLAQAGKISGGYDEQRRNDEMTINNIKITAAKVKIFGRSIRSGL